MTKVRRIMFICYRPYTVLSLLFHYILKLVIKMPSHNFFSRNIEVCSKILTIDQKMEGDVNCVVWDAALVLSKYLEKQYLENKLTLKRINVIELGSGLGCVGLTAACLGANVVLTDLKETISLLQNNIDKNRQIIRNSHGTATAKIVCWGKEIDLNFKPDLILLADCIYYKEAVKLLVKTLVDLCKPDTKILLSQEDRDSDKQKNIWNEFLELAKNRFQISEIPLLEQHPDYRSYDIKLFQLTLLS